jgi:hypothetical protein
MRIQKTRNDKLKASVFHNFKLECLRFFLFSSEFYFDVFAILKEGLGISNFEENCFDQNFVFVHDIINSINKILIFICVNKL